MGDLEDSVGSSTLGVNDALGDALAVKVGEEVNQVEVLQEEGPVAPDPLIGVGLVDGLPGRGSVGSSILGVENFGGGHF